MVPSSKMGQIIIGMREAFARGDNMMSWHRSTTQSAENDPVATLIAYDLQSGSYVKNAIDNPEANRRWCQQLSSIFRPLVNDGDTILEVGVGEATTLSGVMNELSVSHVKCLGFDLSWSRIMVGQNWASRQGVAADLFVADLFRIPLADDTVDVVYTSHSLEPNGGMEKEAIKELMRVARRAVVLVEPMYEFASSDAQERILYHGYVRNLKPTAVELGARVLRHEPLEYSANPLNPSGVLVLDISVEKPRPAIMWSCPMTQCPMTRMDDVFVAEQVGIRIQSSDQFRCSGANTR